MGLERRGVGENAAPPPAPRGPPGGRGVGVAPEAASPAALVAAAEAAATLTAASAAAEAAPAALPLGLVDLRGGALQGRTDVVRLDLVDGALLPLASLVRPLLEPALHDDPHATLEALGDVLGRLPPDVAGEEQRFAVLPLTRLLVAESGRGRDPERCDRLAVGGEAELRVVDQVANDRDL